MSDLDLVTGPITEAGQRNKYIGLALAITGNAAIGTSFIITKKGLISSADVDGLSTDNYSYFKNGLWWAGMLTMAFGEVGNFAAYTFAPPILVTPLGALSVLVGAVLAAIFLKEHLGKIGISGCSLCLVGSIIIILHAPEDKNVETVDEILSYALQPGFIFYCLCVGIFSIYMIVRVAPIYGSLNPLVYISICSLVGSVSVMAVKGFGVALKLTLAGNNQLWRPGTWVFALTTAGCIAVQLNYFNKALDLFPTTVVNPSYFVGFSTCTIIASTILFHGLNTTGGSNTVSLLCGLYTISLGVYLLNLSRSADAQSPEGIDARQSLLLENGGLMSRMSHQRLSMTSDRGNEVRRTSGFYRGMGATVGNVEPIFDYSDSGSGARASIGGGHEQFKLGQMDDDDDDDDDDETFGGSARSPRQQQQQGRSNGSAHQLYSPVSPRAPPVYSSHSR